MIAPEILGHGVGRHEGTDRAEQRDTPASLDALDEIAGVFLEAEREHDHDDPDLRKVTDERIGLDRQGADVYQNGTHEQEPENGREPGFLRGEHGDQNAAPDDHQVCEWLQNSVSG